MGCKNSRIRSDKFDKQVDVWKFDDNFRFRIFIHQEKLVLAFVNLICSRTVESKSSGTSECILP